MVVESWSVVVDDTTKLEHVAGQTLRRLDHNPPPTPDANTNLVGIS